MVVQHHLLRDLNSVRLRHTFNPSSVQDGLHESFVPLINLASEIKDAISTNSLRSNLRNSLRDSTEYDGNVTMSAFDRPSHPSPSVSSRVRSASTSVSGFEYVFVDTDQFYLDPDKISGGKDPKMKTVMKVMKKAQLKADQYIDNELHTILVVDLPFRVVREFNSEAMFSSGASIVSDTTEFMTKHPKHRKTLKTFAMCLDFMLRRFNDSAKETILSVLVFALPDDRFDLLTLETNRMTNKGNHNDSSAGYKKKEMKKDKSGRSSSYRSGHMK